MFVKTYQLQQKLIQEGKLSLKAFFNRCWLDLIRESVNVVVKILRLATPRDRQMLKINTP